MATEVAPIVKDESKRKNEKKPKWRIRRDLEEKLRILKVDRRVLRKIIITIFRIAVMKKDDSPNPIIKAKTVCKEGCHKGNTTYGFFESTMKSESPILKQLEEKNPVDPDFTQGHIAKQAKDILKEDMKIYYELNDNGFLNEWELLEIKELDKLLDKFYGL